jgi:hypothetical protein
METEVSDSKPHELKGILGYVGTTGVGKTYLARQHLEQLRNKGVPGVVIDAATVENFEDLPHAKDAREVLQSLFGSKDATIIAWTPRTVEEFDAFLNAVMEAKSERGVAMLIDEITFWKKSKNLPFYFRTWRHSRSTILVTSQHVSADLGQVLFGCNPHIYIFRTTAPRSLEWYFKWHGLDTDKIREMPDRQYLEKDF